MIEERFKFRAWDLDKKEMHYDVYLLKDKVRVCHGQNGFNVLKPVVMQCLGLEDVHKTPIYEHDILAISNEDGKLYAFEVYWSLSGYLLRDIHNMGDYGFFDFYEIYDEYEVLITGNVFEQPEFIE